MRAKISMAFRRIFSSCVLCSEPSSLAASKSLCLVSIPCFIATNLVDRSVKYKIFLRKMLCTQGLEVTLTSLASTQLLLSEFNLKDQSPILLLQCRRADDDL